MNHPAHPTYLVVGCLPKNPQMSQVTTRGPLRGNHVDLVKLLFLFILNLNRGYPTPSLVGLDRTVMCAFVARRWHTMCDP